MAKMDPAELPAFVVEQPMYRGEVSTYHALAQLGDEYLVFWDRCPNAGTAHAYERRLDFIVMHETKGLLAIEVKGGQIRVGKDGFEQFQHKKGWQRIDPFGQVRKATISLILKVKEDGVTYWIPNNLLVIFPDTRRAALTDQPARLPSGLLCQEDMAMLAVQLPPFFDANSSQKMWKREEFIDMRRRLQHIPTGQYDRKRDWGKGSGSSSAQAPEARAGAGASNAPTVRRAADQEVQRPDRAAGSFGRKQSWSKGRMSSSSSDADLAGRAAHEPIVRRAADIEWRRPKIEAAEAVPRRFTSRRRTHAAASHLSVGHIVIGIVALVASFVAVFWLVQSMGRTGSGAAALKGLLRFFS